MVKGDVKILINISVMLLYAYYVYILVLYFVYSMSIAAWYGWIKRIFYILQIDLMPDEFGFDLAPTTRSSVALTWHETQRLAAPYESKCTKSWKETPYKTLQQRGTRYSLQVSVKRLYEIIDIIFLKSIKYSINISLHFFLKMYQYLDF